MYGIGILKGLGVTFKHFIETFSDDIKWVGRKKSPEEFQYKQSLANRGMVTVEYPDEKLAVPERFRFVPFLVTYNQDDPEYPGKDWCTSCGICAKVCPPQCIWIVRGTNAETGRPKPEPEQFYIDIDICMNCGYCAEYCPFDAIKMDHDYELASYDRTSNHIYDKPKLSKEIRYWQTIAPTTAAEEEVARGGYDHTDVQKGRKKAGLPATRPGPVSDKPAVVAAPAAAAPLPDTTVPVKSPALPEVPPDRATVAQGQQSAATPGAATTPDGKPIVRRRGGPPKKESEGPVTAAPAPAAPATSDASPAVAAAPTKEVAPQPPESQQAPDEGKQVGGLVQRGPKRVIDPNNPPPVVRRRNPPKA